MVALTLILGMLGAAGWVCAEGYRQQLAGAKVLIHIAEGCLSAASDELRYWERVRAEAEPPMTEIPAAFRQAFDREGE